ncbi:MAG: ubiquitin-like domain-containing protein [Oscillospiraceae bacterium]|nr:ubiquitin-like domain-containing protein [Oscillospiraceae bacterium]
MESHSRRKRVFIALMVTLAILLSTTALIAAASDTITVTVHADGQTTQLTTRAKNTENILSQLPITFYPGDFIDDSGFDPDADSTIKVYRAKTITIMDGKHENVAVIGGTVERAITQGDFQLRSEDKLSHPLDAELEDGMVITITRAFNVVVKADGKEKELLLTEGTVKGALKQAGVKYKENDEISPKLDKKLTKDTEITVGRVSYKTRTEEVEIPFTKTTRNTNDLYLGETKVSAKGKEGLSEVTYKDKYLDGKLVSSEKVSTKVLKEPVQQVTLKGALSSAYKPIVLKTGLKPVSVVTPPKSFELDQNGVPKNYKSVVTGLAKSYSLGKRTASGRPTKPGHIAVDPKQFPYGTALYIVSEDGKYVYGYAIAADTGGFVKKNSCMVDLFMPSYADCIRWGARNVRIYVL